MEDLKKPLAWITGAGGLIGSHLVRDSGASSSLWRRRALTRPVLDLTDSTAVRTLFERDQPRLIIHCAAMTRVPACEKSPELAQKLNVEITSCLSALARDIPLVFLSTDLVFDGRMGNYDENASVNPLSVYGTTKAAAERIVLANPRHTVVRTSLNYGTSPSGDRAFNEELKKLWQNGRNLTLFTDEFRCPIAAEATASAVWDLIAKSKPGLYHLAGAERLSRYRIGELLAAQWPELAVKLEGGSLADYHGPPRAPDTSFNCAKIEGLIGYRLPRFSDWLKNHQPAK